MSFHHTMLGAATNVMPRAVQSVAVVQVVLEKIMAVAMVPATAEPPIGSTDVVPAVPGVIVAVISAGVVVPVAMTRNASVPAARDT